MRERKEDSLIAAGTFGRLRKRKISKRMRELGEEEKAYEKTGKEKKRKNRRRKKD